MKTFFKIFSTIVLIVAILVAIMAIYDYGYSRGAKDMLAVLNGGSGKMGFYYNSYNSYIERIINAITESL